MTKRLLFLLLLSSLQFSCQEKNDEKKQYYPVFAFIQEELRTIDSLPIAVIGIHEENNTTDTTVLSKDAFRKIADGLIGNDLKSTESMNEYTETVLEDLALKDITISYTADNKNIALSKIEIHVDPRTELVKSLYAERKDEINSIQIVRKILWTKGKQLLVSSSHYSKSAPTTNTTDRFNW